jgi:rhodanese-related sulfurtransferase
MSFRRFVVTMLLFAVWGCGGGGEPTAQRDAGASAREATPHIDQATLVEMLDSKTPPVLVDVRTPGEVARGTLEGAILIPSYLLESRMQELEPHRDRKIVVFCEVGARSDVATRYLIEQGFDAVNYSGGMYEWRRSRR